MDSTIIIGFAVLTVTTIIFLSGLNYQHKKIEERFIENLRAPKDVQEQNKAIANRTITKLT